MTRGHMERAWKVCNANDRCLKAARFGCCTTACALCARSRTWHSHIKRRLLSSAQSCKYRFCQNRGRTGGFEPHGFSRRARSAKWQSPHICGLPRRQAACGPNVRHAFGGGEMLHQPCLAVRKEREKVYRCLESVWKQT